MAKLWVRTLNITSNPSGAVAAARQGNVVMIVDVIDMSTTAEIALEAGAIEVMGASLDQSQAPVDLNPEKIGYVAGKKAIKYNTEVILAVEPRVISRKDEQINRVKQVVKGIERAGAELLNVISNMGKEVVELTDFKDKILVIASGAGGAAFDAAYNYGAPQVVTGTVARTLYMSGDEPAKVAVRRAIENAIKFRCGISIVAASSNSQEDILAANYIGQEIINSGFLNLDFSF